MTRNHKDVPATQRVLVIFPGALGDLMCVLPAIEAIERRHAGASIELMARSGLAQLAAGRTIAARGHSIDAREVSALFADGPLDSARRLFSQFDRIYSFFSSDDAGFRGRLTAATDAEVSFHPFRPEGDGHVAEAYLRAIGEEDSYSAPRLTPNADDLAAAERVLGQAGCDGSNLIVIFPGSGSPAKNWTAEKFAALATMLEKEPMTLRRTDSASSDKQTSVAIVLGPAEGSSEPIFRGNAGGAVLKDLDLPTVAAIARKATAFVGNDSGVSHLAAAVGTSGVVIFGPTDPARWRPMASCPGQRIEIVRRLPLQAVEPREVASLLSEICSASPNIIDWRAVDRRRTSASCSKGGL
jgi:heptosyltransferase III